jgi:AcrR family transcriptional regulator
VARSTRAALLEEGALLFARQGVDGVTARELHAAVGARNESALHYHFGGRDGLVAAILTAHLAVIEERRGLLVARLESEGRTGDVRELVGALARPMADDLATPLGRAHLRLVARLDRPSLAYERPFRVTSSPAGTAVVGWLADALSGLPQRLRVERLAALRIQLIGLFASRAELVDDGGGRPASHRVFLENLIDTLVAGLTAPPSADTTDAMAGSRKRGVEPRRPNDIH